MSEEYPQADYDADEASARGGESYKEKSKVPIDHGYWKTCEECSGTGKDPRDIFGNKCPLCLGQKQYFLIPAPVRKPT